MPRRVVPIRLVSPYENPSEIPESAFKHSDLEGWVREHRGALIRACLTIVQQGLAAQIADWVRIGSYERYCDVLGAVLAGVGVDGFLGNIARTRQNEDLSAWRQVVALWWQAYGDDWVPAAEVWECIRGDDCPLYFKGDDATAQKRSMGGQLKKREGGVFAIDEARYQIQKDTDTSGRAVYRLCELPKSEYTNPQQVSQVSQVLYGSLHVRARARAHTRAHAENIPQETCETCETCETPGAHKDGQSLTDDAAPCPSETGTPAPQPAPASPGLGGRRRTPLDTTPADVDTVRALLGDDGIPRGWHWDTARPYTLVSDASGRRTSMDVDKSRVIVEAISIALDWRIERAHAAYERAVA
jgi:hypothetical protein